MMRAYRKFLPLLVSLSLACSSGGTLPPPPTADLSINGMADLSGNPPPDLSGPAPDFAGADLAGVDLAMSPPDLAMPPPPDLAGVDLAGAKPDLATPADLSTSPDLSTGGSCTPGASRSRRTRSAGPKLSTKPSLVRSVKAGSSAP